MRSILNILLAAMLVAVGACGKDGRPTDAEVREFAASRDVADAATAHVACGHIVIDKEKNETIVTNDNGESKVIPKVDPQLMRYTHLCTVGPPENFLKWTFVAKLREDGRLVMMNPMTGTDE